MAANEVNPWIKNTAAMVNHAAASGALFQAGAKPSADAVGKFQQVSKDAGDYAELRGVLTPDQVDSEVTGYIGYLNTPEGAARKPVFMNFLQEGAKQAEQGKIDPLLATGNLLLTHGGEGPGAPTDLERALGLDMMGAALHQVYQLTRQG